MSFEEYLKYSKRTMVENNGRCEIRKVYALYFPDKKKFFSHLTLGDMENLHTMEKYLIANTLVRQREFLQDMKENFKEYYELLLRYPNKKHILENLRNGAEKFAVEIEVSESGTPSPRRASSQRSERSL